MFTSTSLSRDMKNLFYRKYSLEKKQRLIEKMISACVLISITKLRLGFHFFKRFRLGFHKNRRPRAPMLCGIKIGIKSTLNQKADS